MSTSTFPAFLEELVQAIAARVMERLAEHEAPRRADRAARGAAHQEREFLNETDVARRTGISIRTLQGWRAQGTGPRYAKAGRRVLYPVAGLEDFLRGQRPAAIRASRRRSDRAAREHSPA